MPSTLHATGCAADTPLRTFESRNMVATPLMLDAGHFQRYAIMVAAALLFITPPLLLARHTIMPLMIRGDADTARHATC